MAVAFCEYKVVITFTLSSSSAASQDSWKIGFYAIKYVYKSGQIEGVSMAEVSPSVGWGHTLGEKNQLPRKGGVPRPNGPLP